MSQQYSVLTDYFESRASTASADPAYYTRQDSGEWQATSWGDFAKQARRLAAGFEKASLASGDALALLLPTGLNWELTQFAGMLNGAAIVGLDEHDLPERLAQIVETSGARGLVVQSAKSLARVPQSVWPQFDFIVSIAEDDKPGVFTGRWLTFNALLEGTEGEFASRAAPDSIATIIFTSGSTGRPKGIPYTHAQVCLAIDDILQAFPEIAAGDRLVCWLPLSNLFQRMINYCAAGRGAETYFVSDPRKIMQRLTEVKPHLFISVPRFFEKLNDGIDENIAKASLIQRKIAEWALAVGVECAAKSRDGNTLGMIDSARHWLADRLVLSKLRQVMGGEIKFLVSGSAPISMWLLERFHGIGMLVLEAYGLSENVTPIAVNRVKDYRFGRVGRPMQSNKVTIAEDGEVLVKGEGVFKGYLGAPASEAGLSDDGYLHTGDLGEFDEQGFLRLVGRKSEIFKTSTGRKVAPVPIEAKLKRIVDIDFAVLIGTARKTTTVILAPSMEAEARLASDEAFRTFARQVCEQIAPLMAEEQSYARPMGALIRRKTFTIDSEELTSNLKLRRKVIEQKYADAIEALYSMLESMQEPNSGNELTSFDKHTLLKIF